MTLVFLGTGGSHSSSHTWLDPRAGSMPLPVIRKPAVAGGELING